MFITMQVETTNKLSVAEAHTILGGILANFGKGENAVATVGVEVRREAKPKDDVDLGFGPGDDEGKEEAALTLTEVIAGFKKYAAKNSREDAGKILKKFKVKSVQDIPAEKYPAVMEALNS